MLDSAIYERIPAQKPVTHGESSKQQAYFRSLAVLTLQSHRAKSIPRSITPFEGACEQR